MKPDDISQDHWNRAQAVSARLPFSSYEKMEELIARAISQAVEEERSNIAAILKDPAAVRVNYLRGGIACQELIDEAVREERSACVSACERIRDAPAEDDYMAVGAHMCANAIRNRSKGE